MPSQWIWVSDAERENTWVRFRKRFTASAAGVAKVRVAVDSKYWLWLNGQLIVREGGLKRGPNPRDTYVDTVELQLKQGENTLAILAWYWGGVTASHNDSGRGGLYVDGPGVGSDATWRASVHPAFGPSERPLFNNAKILPEFPVNFDARLDQPDWIEPSFDDGGWMPAIEAGEPPCEPWKQLVDRPIPLWRDSGIRPYDSVDKHVGKLHANLQVYPWFRIDAPAGETVTVQIERDKKTTTYTTRAGVQEFEIPAWGNGHHVTYTFPTAVKVLELGYRETGYDCDFAGGFTCDDEALNTLWQKAARTTYVCMRDTYMDCPDRERQPWPNDAVPMMEQACYAYDRRADRLFGKMIREFVDWRTEEGILWAPVPNGRFRGTHREIVGVTMAMIRGIWPYFLHSGDEATIDHAYPVVRDYLLKHWQVDPVELVRHRGPDDVQWGPGTQNWYDWGPNQDWRLLDNCWMAIALQTALVMGHSRRDPDGTAALGERARSIVERFHELFWRGTHYASPDYQGPPDERGNAMAALFVRAPRERYPAIRDVILGSRNASIYMDRFCVEALFKMGYPEDAVARIKDRFAAEITSSYSTLPEMFGEESNHGWGGWMIPLIVQHIAGLPEIPSGHLKLLPRLLHLKRLDLWVPYRMGEVVLRYRRSEEALSLDVQLPNAMNGELLIAGNDPALPTSARWIELNGKRLMDLKVPTEDYRNPASRYGDHYRVVLRKGLNQVKFTN